jgi:23S rRNA pseudouridine2605 synthase
VPLNRALSKLAIASRAEATRLIVAGRVRVDGRTATDPGMPVVPERVAISIDGHSTAAADWRLILVHKPRGVVTTRRDPQGRPTVFDLVAGAEGHLIAVGRLDLATSGLILLTTDTRLADWLTDPSNLVPRTYTVTVRGEVRDDAAARLMSGVETDGESLTADEVTVRKRGSRSRRARRSPLAASPRSHSSWRPGRGSRRQDPPDWPTEVSSGLIPPPSG